MYFANSLGTGKNSQSALTRELFTTQTWTITCQKKLSELGISESSFITVVDEEDEQPRVNLQLVVVAPAESTSQEQPIILDKVPEIPRKPKAPTPTPESDHVNGTANLGKRKRDAEEAGLDNGDPPTKRVANVTISDGADKTHPIDLMEDEGGAILIDD